MRLQEIKLRRIISKEIQSILKESYNKAESRMSEAIFVNFGVHFKSMSGAIMGRVARQANVNQNIIGGLYYDMASNDIYGQSYAIMQLEDGTFLCAVLSGSLEMADARLMDSYNTRYLLDGVDFLRRKIDIRKLK